MVAGESVSLTCSVTLPDGVTGTPDFQWEGPGRVTPTPADSTTSGQTASSYLTLSEIYTSQAGQYTCTATLSGSITTSTIITVQSKYMYISIYKYSSDAWYMYINNYIYSVFYMYIVVLHLL